MTGTKRLRDIAEDLGLSAWGRELGLVLYRLADDIERERGGTSCETDAERRIAHLEYLLANAERKAERRKRHIEACERRNAKLNARVSAEHDRLRDIARRIEAMPRELGDTSLRASQLGIIADRIRDAIGGTR